MMNPLQDKDFLKELQEKNHNREVWVKIISLDKKENYLSQIEGKVTGGSINIDGTSSVRRTCSLNLVAKNLEIDINNYEWGLNNKFKVEIGLTNNFNSNYPKIIWFSFGTFICTSFSCNESVDSFNISISGKDKMCQLNGELGGHFYTSYNFSETEIFKTVYEPIAEMNKNIYDFGKYYVFRDGKTPYYQPLGQNENLVLDNEYIAVTLARKEDQDHVLSYQLRPLDYSLNDIEKTDENIIAWWLNIRDTYFKNQIDSDLCPIKMLNENKIISVRAPVTDDKDNMLFHWQSFYFEYYEEYNIYKINYTPTLEYELSVGPYDENIVYYNSQEINEVKTLTLKEIIHFMMTLIVQEPEHNIIINDLDEQGYELLQYNNNEMPLYMLKDIDTGIVYQMTLDPTDYKIDFEWFNPQTKQKEIINDAYLDSKYLIYDSLLSNIDAEPSIVTYHVSTEEGKREATVIKIEYGDTVGMYLTDLVYNGELIVKAGDTVTSVLDKIVNMLGNFEYFYDTSGRFIFQKKRTYLNNNWTPLVETEKISYDEQDKQIVEKDQFILPNSFGMDIMYSFENSETVVSYSHTPQLMNLKNDYSIWGERKGVGGESLPIHYRYAIDEKPKKYTSINFPYKLYNTHGEKIFEGRESAVYEYVLDDSLQNVINEKQQVSTLVWETASDNWDKYRTYLKPGGGKVNADGTFDVDFYVYVPKKNGITAQEDYNNAKISSIFKDDTGKGLLAYMKTEYQDKNGHSLIYCNDWRELIYQMAFDYFKYNDYFSSRGNEFFIEVEPSENELNIIKTKDYITSDLYYFEDKQFKPIKSIKNNDELRRKMATGDYPLFKYFVVEKTLKALIAEANQETKYYKIDLNQYQPGIYYYFDEETEKYTISNDNVPQSEKSYFKKVTKSLYPLGLTGYEAYYTDMQAFWRQNYNPDIEIETISFGKDYEAKYDRNANYYYKTPQLTYEPYYSPIRAKAVQEKDKNKQWGVISNNEFVPISLNDFNYFNFTQAETYKENWNLDKGVDIQSLLSEKDAKEKFDSTIWGKIEISWDTPPQQLNQYSKEKNGQNGGIVYYKVAPTVGQYKYIDCNIMSSEDFNSVKKYYDVNELYYRSEGTVINNKISCTYNAITSYDSKIYNGGKYYTLEWYEPLTEVLTIENFDEIKKAKGELYYSNTDNIIPINLTFNAFKNQNSFEDFIYFNRNSLQELVDYKGSEPIELFYQPNNFINDKKEESPTFRRILTQCTQEKINKYGFEYPLYYLDSDLYLRGAWDIKTINDYNIKSVGEYSKVILFCTEVVQKTDDNVSNNYSGLLYNFQGFYDWDKSNIYVFSSEDEFKKGQEYITKTINEIAESSGYGYHIEIPTEPLIFYGTKYKYWLQIYTYMTDENGQNIIIDNIVNIMDPNYKGEKDNNNRIGLDIYSNSINIPDLYSKITPHSITIYPQSGLKTYDIQNLNYKPEIKYYYAETYKDLQKDEEGKDITVNKKVYNQLPPNEQYEFNFPSNYTKVLLQDIIINKNYLGYKLVLSPEQDQFNDYYLFDSNTNLLYKPSEKGEGYKSYAQYYVEDPENEYVYYLKDEGTGIYEDYDYNNLVKNLNESDQRIIQYNRLSPANAKIKYLNQEYENLFLSTKDLDYTFGEVVNFKDCYVKIENTKSKEAIKEFFNKYKLFYMPNVVVASQVGIAQAKEATNLEEDLSNLYQVTPLRFISKEAEEDPYQYMINNSNYTYVLDITYDYYDEEMTYVPAPHGEPQNINDWNTNLYRKYYKILIGSDSPDFIKAPSGGYDESQIYYTKIEQYLGEAYLYENKYDDLNLYLIADEDIGFNPVTHYHKNVTENPSKLNFWIDFLDTNSEMGKYSVKAIGNRTKVVNDNKISALYFKGTPGVIFVPEEKIEQIQRDYNSASGYTLIQIDEGLKACFSLSSQYKSALDEIDQLLYTFGSCTEQIIITTIPIYNLEPNYRIKVTDNKTKINGEYIVSRISIPFAYNGTSQITATKVLDRIY